MDLAHYSVKPVTKLYSVLAQPCYRPGKPAGIWVSDDADEQSWPAWCRAEEFALTHWQYRTPITLKQNHKVLIISNDAEFEDFNTEYRLADEPYLLSNIDWAAVAKKFGGILITPYRWNFRLHHDTFWYYGWDCASGCIWDANSVELGESKPYGIKMSFF